MRQIKRAYVRLIRFKKPWNPDAYVARFALKALAVADFTKRLD